MTDAERSTRPAGATGQSSKGAQINPTMGPPGSPTGPNETEEGIIKSPAPEGPGEDQIGLVGGNPTESLQSTPPLEPTAEAKHGKDARDAKQEGRKEAR